jgi:hypothetical protein
MAVSRTAAASNDKSKPPSLPLTAKLTLAKTTYPLDLDGLTPEQFRSALKEAEETGQTPNPPAVELTLTLTNTSDKEVSIWGSGDPVRVVLELKGKGAVTIKPKRAVTQEFRVPNPVTLAPGKSYTISLKRLQFGFRGLAEQAYWTEAGDYTLTAHFITAIAPPPPGSKDIQDGFGCVRLSSKPIKIKVEAPK